jgi:hypothetical protein
MIVLVTVDFMNIKKMFVIVFTVIFIYIFKIILTWKNKFWNADIKNKKNYFIIFSNKKLFEKACCNLLSDTPRPTRKREKKKKNLSSLLVPLSPLSHIDLPIS